MLRIQEWQIVAAGEERPNWTGDLSDDCTSRWAGLMLRAEKMDSAHWWWAVYDEETGTEIATSNQTRTVCKSGALARENAEIMARQFLNVPMQ